MSTDRAANRRADRDLAIQFVSYLFADGNTEGAAMRRMEALRLERDVMGRSPAEVVREEMGET